MFKYHKGAVSIFVVVFFSLLITVFAVGFIRLTLKGTQQAATVDMSQDAYDSAQAGIEDAKRALIRLGNVCGPLGNASECTSLKSTINSETCNVSLSGVVAVTGGEVKVQQTTGDQALDQAYTCVTITRNTTDFLGTLISDESKVVPLAGVSNFDRIKIEWFNSNNLTGTSKALNLLREAEVLTASPIPLLAKSDYPTNRPPVLRAHLVQVGPTFNPSNIEGSANTSTMFFYPVSGVITPNPNSPITLGFNDGARQAKDKRPTVLKCQTTLAVASYACAVELTLPSEVTSTSTALLQLKMIYNQADYRVSLCKGSCSVATNVVKFNGVQPMVDSTGRANDLFRRVQVRVEGVDTYPYPESAIQTSGNFCKNFILTDNTADYWQTSSCSP